MRARGRYPQRLGDLWPGYYPLGMWGWVLHRISGLALAFYLGLHIFVVSSARWAGGGAGFDRVLRFFYSRWGIALDLLLIAAVIYHATNGLRILLFDLGLGVRRQREVFLAFMIAGVAIFGAVLWFLLPFVLGRSLPEG